MTNHPPPRDAGQRKRDALRLLETEEDAWVSSASPDGAPTLVPLSFVWHGERLVMSTKGTNPTARNLAARGESRVALGTTRDVVLADCTVEVLANDALPQDATDALAAKLGWNPRGRDPWVFLRFTPHRLLVWREANELAGRELMRDGVWRV
ncbi:pyridoxamine 5'-phosphate oxidase family protein (plasmid) [Streptomyces sp. BHT-5-2]|uniref:pyridoxamine 5'-phosphate oxidase family protein n=1 Tax=unclassified Streptomyces TaxID=2593676 RepID=UPI001C8DD3F9|nr:pyridoxamine 5'-phosphate oxidase family protein [Streptomyces sp. BHT-5-2]QZL08578.1 pyridoxamine 5'-phosphate oxidase family protein [Streptomyces sp. BHT-5-2]